MVDCRKNLRALPATRFLSSKSLRFALQNTSDCKKVAKGFSFYRIFIFYSVLQSRNFFFRSNVKHGDKSDNFAIFSSAHTPAPQRQIKFREKTFRYLNSFLKKNKLSEM